MITIHLKPKCDGRLRGGHLWVFRNELESEPELPAATLVSVVAADGTSYGTGFYHPTSRIAVRLLATEAKTIDADFIAHRLRQAIALRNRLLPNEPMRRLLFGESDLMSGLVIDQYGPVAVVQILSAGMDSLRDAIVDAITTVVPDVTCILEKSTARVRLLEGLEQREGILFGTLPAIVTSHENGITYHLDLAGGQKTGYFLDQKLNRRIVGALSSGKSVLDCFCNVGGFALNAAAGGAASVVGIDSSAVAIEAARRNAQANQFDVDFQHANVFDVLRATATAGNRYDLIVLDPPSFAKSRTAVDRARAGYAEVNRTAMKCLTPGGILVTASCTQVVHEHMLFDILYTEAARLRKRLRLLHRGSQAPDHPILLGMPETQYLKFLVFDVIDN
jgi:23S rRNA (cytosine1962-C5)-methyltransferase